MESILLTGMGMVGAQIVKKLYEQHGITPVVLDLAFHWDYLDTIIPREAYHPIQGSILDRELIEGIIGKHKIERILHAAAVLPMRVGHDAHPGFYEVNTWGSANMMFLARNNGVRKFVMFSTNGVYQFRANRVEGPVSEDFPSGLTPHNSYGNSKAVAEYLLRELSGDGAFIGNIIRPGEIYGPVMNRTGDPPIYWKAMFDAAIEGKPYILDGHPEHRLDWVYCKDVAEIAVRLLLADETPHVEYHATFGQCMGIYDIKAELDRQFPGNRVELRNCLRGGWNFPLSMARAKEDVNFLPEYGIQKGVEDYCAWYQNTRR